MMATFLHLPESNVQRITMFFNSKRRRIISSLNLRNRMECKQELDCGNNRTD